MIPYLLSGAAGLIAAGGLFYARRLWSALGFLVLLDGIKLLATGFDWITPSTAGGIETCTAFALALHALKTGRTAVKSTWRWDRPCVGMAWAVILTGIVGGFAAHNMPTGPHDQYRGLFVLELACFWVVSAALWTTVRWGGGDQLDVGALRAFWYVLPLQAAHVAAWEISVPWAEGLGKLLAAGVTIAFLRVGVKALELTHAARE